MSRLLAELRRLYGLDAVPASAAPPTLLDPLGKTRALVIELARPADWGALARLWDGLQADLGWPAPAIAINGRDGFQLWMALAEPVSGAQGNALLSLLMTRYLADVPAQRVSLWPRAAGPGLVGLHVNPVPAEHPGGQWSAFVSPGLAPVFADTPWLDIPPGEEGQADLLSSLQPVSAVQFREAMAMLKRKAINTAEPRVDALSARHEVPHSTATSCSSDPHAFLLRVMNDEGVDMALRVEAAKALLPYAPRASHTGPEV